MNKYFIFWLILVLAFLSTGCSSISKAEQPAVIESHLLDNTLSLGQTFTARFNGMDGIEIYLEPLENGDGKLQLHLRETPQTLEDLAVVTLPIDGILAPGFYRFPLPVQADSNQQDYYVLLKVKGNGSIKVGTAPGYAYLNGALYQGNHPKDHLQMAFKLTYYLPRLGLGLVREGLTWGWYLLVAIFLFVLPGWALLSRFRSGNDIRQSNSPVQEALGNPFTKFALSIGISLAIYPLLILWTDLFGIHLGAFYAWLPPTLGSIWLIWIFTHKWIKAELHFVLPKPKLTNSVLVLILLLIITTRFWVIRSLPLPLWGDSYHHTIIAQLLVDNKGLFESWQPYTDTVTFTYHFGFHAAVASFHWITGLPLANAVLWVGQIINIFAVITLYPLAIRIFKNRWSGIFSILVAGLLSSMPMFLVNWGRYTQLTGQVILLVAMWFTWLAFENKNIIRETLFITWILVSGLALTHYRILIFYLVFVVSYGMLYLNKKGGFQIIKKTLWIGLGAGILFLPWFINVFGGRILEIFKTLITANPRTIGTSSNAAVNYGIGDLTIYLPILLWLLTIVVFSISIWQKRKFIAVISLCWFILIIIANPHWFHLPGKNILDNFTIFIAVYIPASLILAAIPTWIPNKLEIPNIKLWRLARTLTATIIIFISFWGAWQRHKDVQPENYAIAAYPDIKASEWIKANIPVEARFLVNSFFAYNSYVIVGSDGGWWLPLTADRQTNLPPITYGFESEPFPGYSQWIQEPTQMIEKYGVTDLKTIDVLIEHDISHIYIGQQQGGVNYAGPLRLDPNELSASPNFRPIYHQDRVWIFRLIP